MSHIHNPRPVPVHPVHGTTNSDAASIPGRSSLLPAVQLAVNRLHANSTSNAHELTWVGDHAAHLVPLPNKTPRPPHFIVSQSSGDAGIIPGRNGGVPIQINLHKTTPGGAWYLLKRHS